ncbi:MAG: ABC transporter ATP-binding protein/permease [Segniliparus sp.]|uniref:ABC transporter ATP-binding protein/permease n=1 Tax=Segniliparus sp. TaxID=2804064 RepID=UPI003F2E2F03
MPAPFDRRLARASRSARRYLVLTGAMGLATAGCVVASAVLLSTLVERAVSPHRTSGQSGPVLFGLLAAVFAARGAIAWLHARHKHRAAPRAVAELQTELLVRMAAADQRAALAHRGLATTLVTREIDGIRAYLTGYLPALVLSATVTPATIVAIAVLDPLSGLVVACGVPLVVLFMVLVGRYSEGRSAKRLVALSRLSAELLDVVAGLPTLRALGREFAPARRVRELGRAHFRASMATLRTAFLSGLVLELLTTFCVAFVAVAVGLRLVYGEMSLFAGLAALVLAPEAYLPIRAVGAQFHAAQDGVAACAKTFELFDRLPARRRGSRNGDASAALRLRSVTVAGRDGNAPERLEAVLRPGEITALVGANGSGKSTALAVLLGLVDPEEGEALLGDVPIRELDPSWWWGQIRWVSQIAPSQPAGGGLSLGEAQRAALARALRAPAQVFLLDEPTAHLDGASEAQVVRSLREKARSGATVVVVSHRGALIEAADQVVRVRATRQPDVEAREPAYA